MFHNKNEIATKRKNDFSKLFHISVGDNLVFVGMDFDFTYIYKPNYAFRYLDRLCSALSMHNFQLLCSKHEEDIEAYKRYSAGHRDRVNVQRLWHYLSDHAKQALVDWPECQYKSLKTSVAELNSIIDKLNKFQSLPRSNQNALLDKFVPDLASSPPKFVDHYFLFKLQERDFIDLFALLDTGHQYLWITLLDEMNNK